MFFQWEKICFYEHGRYKKKKCPIFLTVMPTNCFSVPSPPYIIKQPPTDEVMFHVEKDGENDKPFYIECEATGEPAPT